MGARRKPQASHSNITKIKRPPLEIVHWEVGVNMVTDAGWGRAKVQAVCRKYKLEHRQAIVLFNNSKMFGGIGTQPPKCRLYWCWNGEYMTCIPCVDDNDQVSYQLRLNEWMRKSFGTELTNIDEVFVEFETAYVSRAGRLAKLADKASKRMKNRKAG